MAVLWLRFLTEINGKTRQAPPELEANPEVRKALEMVEVAALSPEERAKYDGFQDWLCRETRRANAERRAERLPQVEAERDAANARAEAEKARADAEKARADAANAERDAEKARANEALEKLRQTARNLTAMKLTSEQIAEATGLTADEVERLKS